jgi:hypothetical protein
MGLPFTEKLVMVCGSPGSSTCAKHVLARSHAETECAIRLSHPVLIGI